MKPSVICRSLIAGALLAMAGSASAGIVNTKHNLSNDGSIGAGGTQANSFSGTDEICVFCHTPHGADISANPPLWNRVLSAPTTYTTYASLGSATLDAEIANVGSVSIACLSCHDGTQAMNVMINAPGSGNFDPNGFTLPGTWTGLTTDGTLGYAGVNVNLGVDLQNDHPIGVQYGGGGVSFGDVTSDDPDFVTVQEGGTAGSPFWWVNTTVTGSTNGREKTDMILYTREDFTSGTPEPSVECASCHDPHTEANPTFLRISNAGSAVCLACHTK